MERKIDLNEIFDDNLKRMLEEIAAETDKELYDFRKIEDEYFLERVRLLCLDNNYWEWEHEFQILEEEVPLAMSDYIFKYVIGYSSGRIKDRVIEKTANPLRFKARYRFTK